jgi:hypothetical protein
MVASERGLYGSGDEGGARPVKPLFLIDSLKTLV